MEEDFIKLVDGFVVETRDPKILEEISQLDEESRLLGISFYDMYCVVLQDATKHKKLVSEFKHYMNLKKPATFVA
ncbi:MAG: hypothetical protein KGH89_05370 [Thaumarchaeota archaeon]|nr:hypothetical protein [Nitrososphaerota archaeon]MDE1866237.1 hypothetical protein [Nitrososphaerota archaeon]